MAITVTTTGLTAGLRASLPGFAPLLAGGPLAAPHAPAHAAPVPPVPRPRRAVRTGRVVDEPEPPTGDIGQLTGLRFVAAVWVLLHHASFVPGNVLAHWFAPLAPVVAAGTLGVDLFFVLSGLVLARAYLARWDGAPTPQQAVSFLWARLARIWPLYALVVSLFGVWCLARLVGGGDGVVSWQGDQPGLGPVSWLAQLSMTQLWTSDSIEGISFVLPAWSVSAEWLAYLALPLVAGLAWRVRRAPLPVLGGLAVLAACAPAAVVVAAATGHDVPVFGWVPRIAGGFTAGILTWLVVRRTPATPVVERRAARLVLAATAEVLLVAYWAAAAPATAAVSSEERLAFATPFLPVLIGALCLARTGPAAWLAGERLQHGGRISYALYLVHFPLIEITVVAMTRFDVIAPGSSAAALLVPHVLVASVVLAHLAHRLVEAPAQRRLRAMDPSRVLGSAERR